jgi:hypothetical protein
VGHHRFSIILEVVMAEPGNTDTSKPDPAPADLEADLTKEIKKTKPKKGAKAYDIEQITRLSPA